MSTHNVCFHSEAFWATIYRQWEIHVSFVHHLKESNIWKQSEASLELKTSSKQMGFSERKKTVSHGRKLFALRKADRKWETNVKDRPDNLSYREVYALSLYGLLDSCRYRSIFHVVLLFCLIQIMTKWLIARVLFSWHTAGDLTHPQRMEKSIVYELHYYL